MISLEGVRLLAPPPGPTSGMDSALRHVSEEYLAMRLTEEAAVTHARQLGATIITETLEDSDDFHAGTLAQAHTYTFHGTTKHVLASLEQIDSMHGSIKQPARKPFPECSPEELSRLPLFLASRLDGGKGKYAIENIDQINRVRQLNADYPTYTIAELFNVSELITTPSNHHTSYRLLTTPTGETIAAGLLYSGHTKQDKKRIVQPAKVVWDSLGDSLIDTFENPATPYFLNALDVRSNIAHGGNSIPLMGGPQARPINRAEAAILDAHGIDPSHIEVPAALRAHASNIGKVAGKAMGIVVGIDYIQSATDDSFYYLEMNAGPGSSTYAECWLGGSEGVTPPEAYRALLRRSLASLALQQQ